MNMLHTTDTRSVTEDANKHADKKLTKQKRKKKKKEKKKTRARKEGRIIRGNLQSARTGRKDGLERTKSIMIP